MRAWFAVDETRAPRDASRRHGAPGREPTARRRSRTTPGNGRRAAANLLIALGTLVLSSGGLIQGVAGKDEAFVITLASGILVIYAGFLVAAGAGATRDASPRTANVAPVSSSA